MKFHIGLHVSEFELPAFSLHLMPAGCLPCLLVICLCVSTSCLPSVCTFGLTSAYWLLTFCLPVAFFGARLRVRATCLLSVPSACFLPALCITLHVHACIHVLYKYRKLGGGNSSSFPIELVTFLFYCDSLQSMQLDISSLKEKFESCKYDLELSSRNVKRFR